MTDSSSEIITTLIKTRHASNLCSVTVDSNDYKSCQTGIEKIYEIATTLERECRRPET